MFRVDESYAYTGYLDTGHASSSPLSGVPPTHPEGQAVLSFLHRFLDWEARIFSFINSAGFGANRSAITQHMAQLRIPAYMYPFLMYSINRKIEKSEKDGRILTTDKMGSDVYFSLKQFSRGMEKAFHLKSHAGLDSRKCTLAINGRFFHGKKSMVPLKKAFIENSANLYDLLNDKTVQMRDVELTIDTSKPERPVFRVVFSECHNSAESGSAGSNRGDQWVQAKKENRGSNLKKSEAVPAEPVSPLAKTHKPLGRTRRVIIFFMLAVLAAVFMSSGMIK